uniref:Antitoxin n=1 Tax=Candidatus Kentrum sp. DK TaxID=2126562 RepID=A0A450SXX2_9GAMM|nr:MAG: prevent-host-death family protein [Candidatus Kentron sp. DK]VFJ59018.1 MAG: prevent-host-death family protein [Candidatus Kentron sp. DK]
MRTITASDAEDRFGALLHAAQQEPVRITSEDRPVAIMLSGREYETFSLYERQRDQARKRALELLHQPLPEIPASLSEDEIMEMVNREIADYRMGR